MIGRNLLIFKTICVCIYNGKLRFQMSFRYVLNDEGNIVTASTADHDYGQVTWSTFVVMN